MAVTGRFGEHKGTYVLPKTPTYGDIHNDTGLRVLSFLSVLNTRNLAIANKSRLASYQVLPVEYDNRNNC